MPSIQALNTLATQLSNIGSEHLGQNAAGDISAKTHSWGGRLVSTVQARHSNTAASANRAVISNLLNSISNTRGFGDQFAGVAAKQFGKLLTDGKPISGRQASQVLRDVISMQSQEATARKENIKINASSLSAFLCKPGDNGAPSPLDTEMAQQMAFYGLGDRSPSAEKMNDIKEVLTTRFAALGLAKGHSPSPEEAAPIMTEVCRLTAMQTAKSEIKSLASNEAQVRATFTAVAETRGGGVPKNFESVMKRLEDKLLGMGMIDPQNLHIPDDTEVNNAITNLANKLYDSLDAVNTSTLDAPQRALVKESILDSPNTFTKPMVAAICESIPESINFAKCLCKSGATVNEVRNALNSFTATLETATLDPTGENRELKEGIAGVDEVNTIRHTACSVALQALEVNTEGAKKLLGSNGMGSINHGLNSLRSELAHSPDIMDGLKERVLNEALLTVAEFAHSTESEVANFLAPPKLGQLKMADVRTLIPQGCIMETLHLSEPINLAKMSADIEVSIQSDIDKFHTGSFLMPADSTPHFKEVALNFSEGFLKDFFRGGFRVNGNFIGASGNDNSKRMEQQLDAFVSNFPSPKLAGQICRGLFQNVEGSVQEQFFNPPELRDMYLKIAGSSADTLANQAEHSLQVQTDGSYLFTAEYHTQKEPPKSLQPNTPTGFNTLLEMNVNLDPSIPSGVRATVTNLDILFHE